VEEDNREYNNAGDSDKCYDKAKNSWYRGLLYSVHIYFGPTATLPFPSLSLSHLSWSFYFPLLHIF
jgi:hypothetical protein